MRAPSLADLTMKIENIQHQSPRDYAALGVVVDMVVNRLKDDRRIERVRGRLLSRLQQQHECRLPLGGGFERIEPLGKVRQWSCCGCRRIVTLDEKDT